ncbi:hypothetical protein [Nocardioides sp.]|uniref:hypothetical protein n=1 Tax=Nocardioides sp. TaxID=35761 RepID=UPI002733AE68|nr:hypothetical protein [Nocardioides sp.]MDP3893461.1 hypothetical protein [Nocardioides sp.]
MWHWPAVRRGPLLALGGWLLLVLLLGPWLLLAGLALLLVPRVRWWLRPERPWRVVGAVAATTLVVTGLVVVIPDGWLPIPPGTGLLTTPSYVGRAATPAPVTGYAVPGHPGLARNGTSSMHNDAWASDSYPWSGPLGDRVEVDTAWYGIEECATLAFDDHARLVALCGDLRGPSLHVIDPDSLHKLASRELPGRPDGGGTPAWKNLCAGAYFYLDDDARAVVATTDRRILVVRTATAEGDPVLAEVDAFDLTEAVPADDCLLALMPDPDGRIWFVTLGGLVGALDPRSERIRTLDLEEEIVNSFAVDEDGGVFVVSDHALHRLDLGPGGAPRVTWRAAYDRGEETKPGQLSRGSGTTPTLLADGMVAITDNAEPRMHVVFLHRASGREICRAPVFDDEHSATENSLVGLGRGVVVENNHGYNGPQSTLLGRATSPGLARVDVVDGACRVRWTSDQIAPNAVPKVSLANGLLYTYTKLPSWWGTSAWYLTTIDVRTGRRVFSVRTGTGLLANNHYAAITLSPDGAVYIATLAGMVRVRDRR